MRKLLLLLFVGLSVFNSRAIAGPMACPDGKTYADYAAFGVMGCLLGDKVFSNFSLRLGPNTGAATTPKANQIAVTPINTAANPGFRFTGNPAFHSPPPPGPPAFFSYRFEYDVRVQAGGQPITDASLMMPMPTVAADGSLTIQELICLGGPFESKGICANGNPMATLNVFDTPVGVQLMDSVTFSRPYRVVAAQTLIIADAGSKGSASVDSFTEQFSESRARVDEPGSLAILVAGLMVLGLVRASWCAHR